MTTAPMMDSSPTLTVLGCRGSIPVSGPQFARYGGNTTSFALEHHRVAHAFIDAGTGINAYRDHDLELAAKVDVFLTHYHWDHIQGISMLGEMWGGTHRVDVFGTGDLQRNLTDAISPPVFPVSLAHQENVRYTTMDGSVSSGPFTLESFPLNHPGGAVGYRIEGPNKVILVITDHEAAQGEGFRPPADPVDTVIFDAQYLPSEAATHRGWGHSTWRDAVDFAQAIDAESLVLTSHDPGRSDDDIDAMVEAASAVFSATQA
ncbi:MAG: MBL fold metallo-hydrolase, partial [Acidimicrobiia bacterium]